MKDPQENLRRLPALHRLQALLFAKADPRWSRSLLTGLLREEVESWRARLTAGEAREVPGESELVEGALGQAQRLLNPPLRPVVNATGVVLHTNLGRAVLSPQAREAVARVLQGYSNLEYDLEEGRRGSRQDHLEEMLVRLTGAEAALVVNNNAAAVFLALRALAQGREVVISRGELVEIGGSFRVPDVMAESGAILREIGTTNKTRLSDYERALGPDTALLLLVHQSNFRQTGFTARPAVAEVVALGRRRGVPVLMDLGSGVLVDLPFGEEPSVGRLVAEGVDLLTFSGDKLLGGPQAGIVVGRRELVAALRSHPLARALRVDKTQIAALWATLEAYTDPDRAWRENPTLEMLSRDVPQLAREAERLAGQLAAVLGEQATVAILPEESQPGGGSLPGVGLRTMVVAVEPRSGDSSLWASLLRQGEPAVVCRQKEGRLLLDPRTLLPGDAERMAAAFARIRKHMEQEEPVG